MDSRANLLSEGTCSVCPKVGEVLPTVERHEEIHDDIFIPRGARAGHFGKDKVSKGEMEVKASELGRGGREEGAIVPHFSSRRQSALLEKVVEDSLSVGVMYYAKRGYGTSAM